MTEVSARRAATRERLCEAAIRVFAEKGVLGSSVEEICDAAGFTRGAFYSNFTSKDDLGVAVLETLYHGQRRALEQAVASVDVSEAADLDDLISLTLGVFFSTRQQSRDGVIAAQELRLHAARSPEMASAYQDFHERSTCAVADVVGRVLAEWGYELATSGPETMGILHAVHDYGAIGTLIGSRTDQGDLSQRLLTELLRTIVRPSA